ncbi:pyrimidine utilization protein D [Pluralibacter gergoviae]|nr:pyrimidine utilization protein D [Pluralibacter gergoviae]
MSGLHTHPAPYAGAPVVVMVSGLGGTGGYWLPQLAVLKARYQVLFWDQRGTGSNPATLADDYSMAMMARELRDALAQAGFGRVAIIGHALGALIGLQMALDFPEAVSGLVLVNGWLSLSPHTRRCFAVRERLLAAGGAEAWVEAQPLFLYPADWMAEQMPRLEAEEALGLSHFQGEHNLRRRLAALKGADFTTRAQALAYPALVIAARDDLLVPSACSTTLHRALPDSTLAVMASGGHACNVTEPDIFNALLLDGMTAHLFAEKESV